MAELREIEQRFRVYSFFARLFMEPIPVPGKDFVQNVLANLEAILGEPEELSQYFQKFYRETLPQNPEHVQKLLAVDRTYLCRGTQPGAGFMPPYESAYSGGDEQQVLISILECYSRNGVEISRESREKPDYIGLELAFMAELCAKERDFSKKRAKIRKEQRLFLAEHLGKWAPLYLEHVERYAKTHFFKGIALCLRHFLADEIANTV